MKISLKHIAVPLVLTGLFMAGCGNKASGIATVNGSAITEQELYDYLQAKSTVRVNIQGQVVDALVQDTLAFQAMQDLVIRKIVMEMAKENGVTPTAEDVEKEVQLRTAMNPTFVELQTARGLTLEGIRSNLEFEIAQQRIMTKGITVTDAEVDEYIKGNPNEFKEPAAVEALVIYSTEPKKASIDSALKSGRKFQDVAVEFSDDPNARSTGARFLNQMGRPPEMATLQPQVKSAIEKTGVNQTTEWIAADNGRIVKFFVNRKIEEKPIEITPERKTMIRRALAVQRGSQGKDIQQTIRTRLQAAKVEVTDDKLKKLWTNFEEALKKSASSTGATGN